MPQFVITAVGPDRPGIVREVTGHLLEAGANVADSRMVNLRGQFALILLAESEKDIAAKLNECLRELAGQLGMTINLAPQITPIAPAAGSPLAGVPFQLRAHAMDRPGIVHQITRLLSNHGVNIEELQTHLQSRGYANTPVFTLDLRMTVPANASMRQLRTELEALSDSLNCSIDLQPG